MLHVDISLHIFCYDYLSEVWYNKNKDIAVFLNKLNIIVNISVGLLLLSYNDNIIDFCDDFFSFFKLHNLSRLSTDFPKILHEYLSPYSSENHRV